MLTLFISRELREDSVILKRLPNNLYKWTDRSLIQFTQKEFVLPDTTWLFFYSPRAITFFSSGLNDQQMISRYKCGCFGEGTANQFFKTFGISCSFTGTGEKESTATIFKEVVQRESVTFVSGIRSLRSIQKLLGEDIFFQELAVYNNRIKNKVALGLYDIAILTSPLNVRAFVYHHGKAKNYIALGKSTLDEMQKNGIDAYVTGKPSELEIVNSIEYLIRKIAIN